MAVSSQTVRRKQAEEIRPCLQCAATGSLRVMRSSNLALPLTTLCGSPRPWHRTCRGCFSRCHFSSATTFFHATLFVVLLSFVTAMPQVVSVLLFLAGLLVIVPIYYHQVFKERKVAQRVQRCSQAATVHAAGAAATGPN